MSSNITYIPKKEFSFQNKFLGLSDFDYAGPISSSIFHIYEGLGVKASFSLELRPTIRVIDQNKSIRFLKLYMKSHTSFPVRCCFEVELNQDLGKFRSQDILTFNNGKERYLITLSGKVSNPLKLNELIVKVEGILFGDVQNEMIGDKSKERTQERSTIAKEVSLLYSSSDIEGIEKDISISFSTCDQILHAHSFILMLRSPVFRAMLSDQYQESITKVIKIEDIGFDCFKQILDFLYTDECELHENTFELLKGSIKYGIQSLEMKIEIYLLDSINDENAALYLYYSDLYRAESLKQNTLEYISRNIKCINTEGFFETINNVQLHAEILTAVSKYSKNISTFVAAK